VGDVDGVAVCRMLNEAAAGQFSDDSGGEYPAESPCRGAANLQE